MLHFNATKSQEDVVGGLGTVNSPQETSAWKVLVLDAAGQRILSPVMKVNDLRDHGVTLYLQLQSDRQAITDVPAVYFVEPTAENISRICQDLQANLYESYYLNFTSSIPRALLEDLAYNSVQSNASGLIAKNMFSLNMPEAFVTLNDASSSDTLIDTTLEHASAGIFSVLLTMGGQPPLIYASKGTAAESLGEKLDTRIRNYLANARTTFLGSQSDLVVEDSIQRPLMLLLDRNFDVSTLLRHTSTYNALVHDVLGMRFNRVSIVRNESGNMETKVFDIDVKDTFWQQNASLPFPSVAENVDIALNTYKQDKQQLTRNNTGVADLENVDDLSNAGAMMTADDLKVAISVLPEMQERKRIIDSHLQMSTALLEKIKSRDLGNLFHMEQEVSELTKAKMTELLRSKEGAAADKMRLFLVYFFAQEEVSKEDMALYEVCLREANCDLSALEYCKKIKAFKKMSAKAVQHTATSTPKTGGDFLQNFGSRISGGVLGNMLSGVRNLLPESADTLLTKLVDSAIEAATGAATGTASALRNTFTSATTPKDDQFTIFDPKASRDRGRAQTTSVQRSAFNQLIVFIVGGSNYTEYNHVEEFLRKKQLKLNLTFGSTELLTGEEFLGQLSKLYRP